MKADAPESLHRAFHAFFAFIPHDSYRKNNIADYEGHYASETYCYFAALGLEVTPEDTISRGRTDPSTVFQNRVYLLELRPNERSRPGRTLDQIKALRDHEKFAALPVTLMGMEFSSEKRNIVRFDWERLPFQTQPS